MNMSKKYPILDDKEWLHQKYWIEELSTIKTAKIVGCSKVTILRALERHNIKRRTYSEAHKGKKSHLGKHHSEAARAKIGKAHKGKCSNRKGVCLSERTKQKMRDARKRQKSFPTHHTKPELVFEEICKKYNLPFKYTGDSAFWIGKGKDIVNPDFIHLTKKMVIEIFSWHHDQLNNRHVKPKGRYEDRKKILKKYGYKMIVFWQGDLEREDAEQFVLSVLKKAKGSI